jgi:hypothetical protein
VSAVVVATDSKRYTSVNGAVKSHVLSTSRKASTLLESRSYKPVGVCIYCGSKHDLRVEHIVPYSLGGTAKLPAASCGACEEITARFEGRLARTMYGDLRIRLDLPTRRKKTRPLQVRAEDAATGAEVWLNPEESLTILPAVHFLPPGILRDPPEEAATWVGATFEAKQIAPASLDRWPKIGSNNYIFTQRFDADALALTLAKIAHAYCVADFGIENFEAFLPPIIRGEHSNIYTYVGGSPDRLCHPGQLHSVQLHLGHRHYGRRADWLLMVSIGLLSHLQMPTALVVVGRADRDWALREAARRQG